MIRFATAALVAATPALGQRALPPDPPPGAPTCGAFLATTGYPARLAAPSGVLPLGGGIGAGDEAAARQWADQVATACQGRPDRPLADVRAAALGAD